jgi:hypothetical protein
MEFKEWLNSNDLASQVNQYLAQLNANALKSIKVRNGRLSISFAPATVSLPAPQAATPAAPYALAAHTTHDGPNLQEDDAWDHRHDKGWTAFKALKKINDPGWDKTQEYRFKSNLTHAVADIAQPLGFLYELEVFIYLRDKEGLFDGDKSNQVDALRKEYIKSIEKRLGMARDQILHMLQVHAADLGKQIIARCHRIFGCADMVWFTGGKNTSFAGRNDPADIQVGCSEYAGENDRAGFSVKFGSETRISVAKLTPKTAIETALGRITAGQERRLSEVGTDDEKQWIAEMSEALYDIIAAKYENNPRTFVELLNHLLTGGNHTFPAARNYASTELGGAEWSGNFRKDFIVGDKPGTPLRAKSNAIVEVDYNKSYFRMTYKVEGGSFSGTTLMFVPRQGGIDVKVTNLTSSRR